MPGFNLPPDLVTQYQATPLPTKIKLIPHKETRWFFVLQH